MTTPAIRLEGSTLTAGGRAVWSDLSLTVPQGEFLTVIGPNGAGKTSLLKVLLGLLPATGSIEVLGGRPRRGNPRIGYVPQHRGLDDVALRGRDLVRLGVDGARWGWQRADPKAAARVEAALAAAGATGIADAPAGRISGGEQQRLRIAQALAGEPDLLLCDEPLLSLDLHHQREVCGLIAAWRDRTGGSVLFVTHDVNPVLEVSDRVLALAGGRWAAGTPPEVLTTESMTRLYGTDVEVVNVRGRVIVLADAFDPLGAHHD